jgi:hypothetical protein
VGHATPVVIAKDMCQMRGIFLSESALPDAASWKASPPVSTQAMPSDASCTGCGRSPKPAAPAVSVASAPTTPITSERGRSLLVCRAPRVIAISTWGGQLAIETFVRLAERARKQPGRVPDRTANCPASSPSGRRWGRSCGGAPRCLLAGAARQILVIIDGRSGDGLVMPWVEDLRPADGAVHPGRA